MTDHPPITYRLMELAEGHTALANVPPDLQGEVMRYCEKWNLINTLPAEVVQPAWPTRTKKAENLRPGDVIQFRPDDAPNGYGISTVTVGDRHVSVVGSGHPARYYRGADVTVYDGPRPLPVCTRPAQLRLTVEGQKSLTRHRLMPVSPNGDNSDPSAKPDKTAAPPTTTAPAPPAPLLADEAKVDEKEVPAAFMGHARDDMASVYRERISDERLKSVTDYVRRWLFPHEIA